MGKRLILYSKGQLFEKYKLELPWKQIVAIIDKNANNNETIMGKPVVKPSDINKFEYDYIVVFSSKYFFEIIKELIYERNIPFNKIASWRILFDSYLIVNEKYIKLLCRGLFYNKVLLDQVDDLDRYILNRESIGISFKGRFDTCTCRKITNKKYDNIYNDYKECIYNDYDAIISGRLDNIDYFLRIRNWKKIILLMPYSLDEKKFVFIKKMVSHLYYRIHIGINGWIWEIDNTQRRENTDISIYVVTHKDYPLIKKDDCYTPICVGGKYKNPQYYSELDGENIAYLNDKINECTALYWIWKNTKEEIVGLNHYRRYFQRGIVNNRVDILSSNEIYEIISECDIILPLDEGFDITVKEQLLNTIPDKKIAELGLKLIREGIKRKQPDYLNAFDDVMNSYNFYRCNMFITRRNLLNQYCEWLFSFLIDVAEQIDVSKTDEYSKRVVGFLAERLLTVWLRKNPQKIRAVPYLLL